MASASRQVTYAGPAKVLITQLGILSHSTARNTLNYILYFKLSAHCCEHPMI